MNGPFAAAAALVFPLLLGDLFVGSGEFPPFLHLLIRRRFVSYHTSRGLSEMKTTISFACLTYPTYLKSALIADKI